MSDFAPGMGVFAITITIAASACVGRYGFDPVDEDVVVRPDAATPAAPPFDSSLGFGSYRLTTANVPYVTPVGAQLAPGFVDGVDEETFGLALPFTFTFFGVPYDVATVSVNGWVTFSPPPSGAESFDNDCPVDGSGPDALIAVFWDDLFASSKFDPKGAITFVAEGDAPQRTFTIEWRDLDGWYLQGQTYYGQRMRVTQKLTLHETGVIDIHYGSRTAPTIDRDCGLDRHRGCSATVGLRAPGNASADTIRCGGASATLFTPIDEGLQFTLTPE